MKKNMPPATYEINDVIEKMSTTSVPKIIFYLTVCEVYDIILN